MMQTVLFEHHQRAGATVADEDGVVLPRHFGDAAAEYRALRDDVVVIDAGYRTMLRVTGSDRVSFLQGMLTNDVAALAPGQGCLALSLTVQGRVLADVRVAAADDALWLDVDCRVRDAFAAALDKLIIADDVELVSADPPVTVIAVEGPRAADLVPGAAGLAPYAHARIRVGDVDAWCVRASAVRGPGVLLHVPADAAVRVWEALVAHGARACGQAAAEARRIEMGVPRIVADMDEHCLSLEVPMDEAISFKKGCYLGQEVVARGTARGQVQRKLLGLHVRGTEPPRGATLRTEEREVGTLTSVACSPARGHHVALGFVRRECWAEGTVLQVAHAGGPTEATVAAFPLA